MTRAISINFFDKIKEKVSQIGEVTKRWNEIKNMRVEAKAIEGIEFEALPEGQETLQLALGSCFSDISKSNFAQVPSCFLLNRSFKEFGDELSHEQLELISMVDHAAELSGLELEIERLPLQARSKPIVYASLKPSKTFHELIDSRFEDHKALPPPSADIKSFYDFFCEKPDLEAVRRKYKKRENDSKRT